MEALVGWGFSGLGKLCRRWEKGFRNVRDLVLRCLEDVSH